MTDSVSPTVGPTPGRDDRTASPPAELQRDLQQFAVTPGAEPPTLRVLVCAYVGSLKTAGVPPERVIVAVKAAARDAGLRYGDALESRMALDRIVRWAILEYYRAD